MILSRQLDRPITSAQTFLYFCTNFIILLLSNLQLPVLYGIDLLMIKSCNKQNESISNHV